MIMNIFLVGAVEETSISQAQALFDTNVLGVLRMIQAVLPGKRRQGSGQIVNINSILGFLPAPFMAVYVSTKHAIEALLESLDHEVRARDRRVVDRRAREVVGQSTEHGALRAEI